MSELEKCINIEVYGPFYS